MSWSCENVRDTLWRVLDPNDSTARVQRRARLLGERTHRSWPSRLRCCVFVVTHIGALLYMSVKTNTDSGQKRSTDLQCAACPERARTCSVSAHIVALLSLLDKKGI